MRTFPQCFRPNGSPKEMPPRVMMADVARQAGVHITTVSLALRNHPSLPLVTRERIQSLARQMGYQPDPALQALIAYRRRALPHKSQPPLAYVTHWDTEWGWRNSPAHAEFFAGASARAQDFGYRLEHFWLGAPRLSHRRMSDILFSRGITGLIIASHRSEYGQALEFDWPRFSAVKIDFCPSQPELHNVTNDQRAVSQLAMQRVMSAGYRRIGFIVARWWDDFVDLACSAGFLAVQQRLAAADRIPILFFPLRLPVKVSLPPADGFLVPREIFEPWFRRYRPEVLISYGPFVRPLLTEMGIAIPRDVAYVETFLGKPDGRTAGIRQNCGRVGELAVEILASQLQQHIYGVPAFPTTTLVEGTWFDGKSLPLRRARPSRQPAHPAAAGGTPSRRAAP